MSNLRSIKRRFADTGLKGRMDMTTIKKVAAGKILMGKLGYSRDLLDEITRIGQEENIQLGRVKALGAVQKARLGFIIRKTGNLI